MRANRARFEAVYTARAVPKFRRLAFRALFAHLDGPHIVNGFDDLGAIDVSGCGVYEEQPILGHDCALQQSRGR